MSKWDAAVGKSRGPSRLAESMAKWAIILATLLWPVLTFAGGLGLSPLLALTGLACLPLAVRSMSIRIYSAILAAALIYAAVASAWLQGEFSLLRIDEESGAPLIAAAPVRLAFTLLWGAILIQAIQKLTPKDARFVLAFAVAGLGAQVGIVVLLTVFEAEAIELFSSMMSGPAEGVQNISRNQIILSVVAPVLAMLILRHVRGGPGRALAAGVLAVAFAAALSRGVDSAIVSVLAGLIAGGLSLALPRSGFVLAGGAIATLLGLAPLLFGALSRTADPATAASSADWRLAIWKRATEFISEAPILGSGVGFLRTIDETIASGAFAGQRLISNHPHNMYLQVWVELGAIGAALFGVAIAAAGLRMPNPGRLGASGVLATALVAQAALISMVSFDLWNDWWWALCCFVAAFIVLLRRADGPEQGYLFRTWREIDKAAS